MRFTSVQVPSKIWPTSSNNNGKFRFSFDDLFRKAGRIDVYYVDIGNEQKVPILRKSGLTGE